MIFSAKFIGTSVLPIFARPVLYVTVCPSISLFVSVRPFVSKPHPRQLRFPSHALARLFVLQNFLSTVLAKEDADASATTAHVGRIRADLPEFGSEEIRRHDSLENRVWVTYKDGVYDITDFIGAGNHPGGNKIYMAAGNNLNCQ